MATINFSFMNLVVHLPDNTEVPIYYSNPKIIVPNIVKDARVINEATSEIIRVELMKYINALDFTSRIKARHFMYSKNSFNKLSLISFVHDEEIIARTADVNILDFILKFCHKYNCMDILWNCIEKIGPQLTMIMQTEFALLNEDAKYQILSSNNISNIEFKWAKDSLVVI